MSDENPPLVFLHYFGGSSESWQWVMHSDRSARFRKNCPFEGALGFDDGRICHRSNPGIENRTIRFDRTFNGRKNRSESSGSGRIETAETLKMKSKENGEPELVYWHVWTDENGISRQTKCRLTQFEQESMDGAAPQWNNRLLSSDADIVFAELPAGWVGEWHENPSPQWIVPLSGRWFVETMDGDRVEMGPGEISFGGDQNTKQDEQGREGHRSGSIGNQPARLMLIQLKDKKWSGAKPGDFEQ